jgi:hypothetical protein
MDMMLCFAMFGFILLVCTLMIIYLSLTRPSHDDSPSPMNENNPAFLGLNERKINRKFIIYSPEKK